MPLFKELAPGIWQLKVPFMSGYTAVFYVGERDNGIICDLATDRKNLSAEELATSFSKLHTETKVGVGTFETVLKEMYL